MPSLYQGQGSPSPVSAPTSSTWSSRYCCSSRSRYPASTASVHLRPPPAPPPPLRHPRSRNLARLNRTAATAQQSSGSVRTTGTSHTASAAAATARTDGRPPPPPKPLIAEANLPGFGSVGAKRLLVLGSCLCPKLLGPIRVCPPRVGCLPAFPSRRRSHTWTRHFEFTLQCLADIYARTVLCIY
jgi:hypothetical protein